MPESTEILPFTNDEFSLDLIPDGDSFKVIASTLAHALGFRDAYNLTQSIPEAEQGYTLVSTPGGEQRVLVVTEPGFYRALGQRQAARIPDSRIRERVERFQSWVYGDVLPSIRRAGSAAAVPAPVSISVTLTNALAELAHDEHVVPAAARILAFKRWRKPRKGIETAVQLALDIRLPGIDGGQVDVRALPAKDAGR